MKTSNSQTIILTKEGIAFDVSLPPEMLFEVGVDLLKAKNLDVDNVLDAVYDKDETITIKFKLCIDGDIKFVLFEDTLDVVDLQLFIKALLLPKYYELFGKENDNAKH